MAKKMPKCLRKRSTSAGRRGTMLPGWKMNKQGQCVKARRSYKVCKSKRTTVRWEGVPVILPCGTKALSDQLKAKIDDMYDAARWNQCKQMNRGGTDRCRLIFFNANTPIIRREGKKLPAPRGWKNRPRWAKTGGKHRKGQFKSA